MVFYDNSIKLIYMNWKLSFDMSGLYIGRYSLVLLGLILLQEFFCVWVLKEFFCDLLSIDTAIVE